MIFDLDVSCFKHGAETFELVTLAKAVLNGRHRLFVSDYKNNDYLEWLTGLDLNLRETWELSLDHSFKIEALEPAKISIKVCQNSEPNCLSSPPVLRVVDASSLATEPFRVFVENDDADRDFLLTFADSDQKSKIEELEKKKLLRFEHSGGIGELKKKVSRFAKKNPLHPKICVAVFDSDAPQPDDISPDALAVVKECKDNDVGAFMLKRRAIENYLLRSWLNSWANCSHKSKRSENIDRFNNFCKLNESQRAHFHMKNGLNADLGKIADEVITLYRDLDETVKRRLKRGFGSGVGSELYSSLWVQDNTHPTEDPEAWDEVNGIVKEFLTLCR